MVYSMQHCDHDGSLKLFYARTRLRSAGGLLRLLRKEKYIKLCEADRGPQLIVRSANWRL